MTVTPDTIFQLIKDYEAQFPIPAPYVTINVGAFDAASGVFTGLKTTVETDPEPVEHQPGQHPTNGPGKFVGQRFVTVTIDAHWKRTTRSEPAPKTALAPVQLMFTITNATTDWSVTVNGVTETAPAGQTTLVVGAWDATSVSWSIQCGARSYADALRVQRPDGLTAIGLGAFVIPVLPVTVVYAPPVDSLKLSTATYTQGETIGSTVDTSFGTDSSQTTPNISTSYGVASQFKGALDTIVQVAGLGTSKTAEAATKIFGDVSGQMGQLSSTHTEGMSDMNEDTITLTRTTTDAIATNVAAGGPGAGDVIHFYKNVQMIWSFFNGQLRLCPLAFTEVFVSVSGLQNDLAQVGISAADAQLLLSFDPLVANVHAALPADRFSLQETWEYGLGLSLEQALTVTRDTKDVTTSKTYTTDTNEWDPGPIFKLFGLGEKDQTTVTMTNAIGTDVSTTATMDAKLSAGPSDYFSVGVYYDALFGTFLFQPTATAAAGIFTGGGAHPGQTVTLNVGGKVFRTVADASGHFGFRTKALPAGAGLLTIGAQAPRPVTVKNGPVKKGPIKKPLPRLEPTR